MSELHEQTAIDMDDTEHLAGAIPAGSEQAQAAHWRFYTQLRDGAKAQCIPDQLIHCFDHPHDRHCACGRVKAVKPR